MTRALDPLALERGLPGVLRTLVFLLIDSSYDSLVKKQELRSENNVPAFSKGQRCSAA